MEDANDTRGDRRRLPGRGRRARPPDLHPAAQPHRLGGAQRPGHLQGPRRRPRARTRSGRPRRSTAGTRTSTSTCPRACTSAGGSGCRDNQRGPGRLGAAPGGLRPRPSRSWPPSCGPRSPASCPPAGTPSWSKLFAEPKKQATRKASQQAINAIAPRLPTLVGGSADLAESNLTDITDGGRPEPPRRSGATSTTASASTPWGRSATAWPCTAGCGRSRHLPGLLRLHAAQRAPGQPDGPAGGVRLDPRLDRAGRRRAHPPAGRAPGVAAGHAPSCGSSARPTGPRRPRPGGRRCAGTDGPTALALSRQELPPIDRSRYAGAEGLHRGAYVLAEADGGEPRLVLIATGSEVWVALEARERLESATGSPPGWCRCPAGSCSRTRTRTTATRCCRPGDRPGWRWRPAAPASAGAAGSATTARSSPATTSAPRPPASWCWRSSASPPDNVVDRARRAARSTSRRPELEDLSEGGAT